MISTWRADSRRLTAASRALSVSQIRRAAITEYGATRGEIGWVLDDNQGMNAIADAIDSQVNKIYQIYEKAL